MSKPQDAFSRLIHALKILPNVGPKSAQRMAYQLLQYNREGAEELVEALQHALKQVRHCTLLDNANLSYLSRYLIIQNLDKIVFLYDLY